MFTKVQVQTRRTYKDPVLVNRQEIEKLLRDFHIVFLHTRARTYKTSRLDCLVTKHCKMRHMVSWSEVLDFNPVLSYLKRSFGVEKFTSPCNLLGNKKKTLWIKMERCSNRYERVTKALVVLLFLILFDNFDCVSLVTQQAESWKLKKNVHNQSALKLLRLKGKCGYPKLPTITWRNFAWNNIWPVTAD